MSTSVADGMIRPRVLYITTSDLSIDAFSSSSVRINLKTPIIPQEGFSLAGALRSFGFNATAYNISEEQKNNVLCIRITYFEPIYIFNSKLNQVESNPKYTGETNKATYQKILKIKIPDGLYQSLEELFENLSSEEHYFLWSGVYTDIEEAAKNPTDKKFLLPLQLLWKETSSGFSVEPKPEFTSILARFTYNETLYFSEEFFHQIEKIEILHYDPETPDTQPKVAFNLYELLFTNNVDNQSSGMINSEFAGSVISKNPPDAIVFYILSYRIFGTLDTEYAPLSQINFHIWEEPYKQIDTSATPPKWQRQELPYISLPWKSFITPVINPTYFDVSCAGITTNSLTESGDRGNLLHRQFLGGAAQGLTSSFQEFNNPVYMTFDYRESVDYIQLNFESEKNLWYFYNMQFYLEFVFFEVKEEKDYEQPPFTPLIPEGDYTSSIQKYTNARNNLQPYANPLGRNGVVYFSQDDQRDKKRRR